MSETPVPNQKPESGAPSIAIEISDDGLTAVVSHFIPPGPGQRPVSALQLTNAMQKAGIKMLDCVELDDVIIKASKGKDITGMIVARGVPPQDAEDAYFKPVGDLSYPVLRNEVFAKLIAAQPARPGTTVTGNSIPPRSQRKPKELAKPKLTGCVLNADKEEVTAEFMGIAELVPDGITVTPILVVSHDSLFIHASVFPKDFSGAPLKLETFKRELWAMGSRTSADRSLTHAIRQSTQNGTIVTKVVAAKGIPAINGRNGQFEVLLEEDDDADIEEEAVIDPRERSIFKTIQEGMPIGKLHAPTEGRIGRDVYGADLTPKKGKPLKMKAGENVAIDEDGVTFVATAPGMISWVGNTISVKEVIKIKGDVSYATGNIRIDSGSVDIGGSVIEGFTVTVPGDILVGGTVESAKLMAEGNIGVKGGITMGGVGHVIADGDVACSFAENAIIRAGHNVVVTHNLSTSTVTAKGYIRCRKGRGVIIGGHLTAGKGVEANEIGSEFGVATHIVLDTGISLDSEEAVGVIEERKKLRAKRARIHSLIGSSPADVVLQKTPPAKWSEVQKIINVREAIEKKLDELQLIMEQRRNALEQLPNFTVKVHHKAHPGTTITIGSKTLKVNETTGPCVFYFDPGKMRVVKR